MSFFKSFKQVCDAKGTLYLSPWFILVSTEMIIIQGQTFIIIFIKYLSSIVQARPLENYSLVAIGGLLSFFYLAHRT